MVYQHEAPWRQEASFGERARSDLADIASEGWFGWPWLVILALTPFMVVALVVHAIWGATDSADRVLTVLLALGLSSPLLGLAGPRLWELPRGEGGRLVVVGAVYLLMAGLHARDLRVVLRPAPLVPVGPDPGFVPHHPQPAPSSVVWLRDPAGQVRSVHLGPVLPVVTVAVQGRPVPSRVAAMLGDTGRWVVPPTVPAHPGHLVITEVLPSGQVSFHVWAGAAPVARMWADAQPVHHPQERS